MNDDQKIFIEQVKNFIEQVAVRKDWLYIFQPCSIGDFFYTGGLSHAVQKRKNKSATVMVVQERMRNLHVTYSNIAQIIYLPANTMTAISNYVYLTENTEGDNYIYGHFKKRNGQFVWDEKSHLIDRYKEFVFSIPQDTPFVSPIVERISPAEEKQLEKQYTLDKDRTIIISPYVHSTKQLPISFWENLAVHLKQRGYVVYTNTDGISEQPVAGTEAMATSFPELYYLSDKVNCFIGGRNGVTDFLAMTNAKILSIVPFPEWSCNLDLMYPGCNNRTFYNAVEYMRPVVEYFERGGVQATISVSREYINSAEIYFDYEIMSESILNSVD